jgi:NAD kinase
LNDLKELNNLAQTMDEINIIKARLMKVEITKSDNSKEIKYAINDVVV